MGLGYAGDITVTDAWSFLSQNDNSVLLDVRTETEWKHTGVADLDKLKKQPKLMSWRVYPNFEIDPNFLSKFEALGIPKNASILIVCKAGGRSREAAMALTSCGYQNCYNIDGGMEGAGGNNGWLASGLPVTGYLGK